MVKHTRKSISRHNKKDLLKFARDNGLSVKSSMSKKIIVDVIFKNKSVRALVPEKAKRKLSDKQRANLERFRFKKTNDKILDDSAKVSKPIEVAAPSKPNPRSNKKVMATSSNKNEPAPVTLKQNPTTQVRQSKKVAEGTIKEKDLPKAKVQTFIKTKEPVTDFKTGEKKEKQEVKALQTKIDVTTRDKASKEATKLKQGLGGTQFDAKRQRALDSHSVRLRKNIYLNAKKKVSSTREHAISTEKSTDYFDRRAFNNLTSQNKKRMRKALEVSKRNHEAGFVGEIADITGEVGFSSVEELLELEAKYKSGKISQLEYKDGIERIRFLRDAQARGQTREQSERLLVQHLEKYQKDRVTASYIKVANKQNTVDKLDLLIKLKEEKRLDLTSKDLVDNIIDKAKQEIFGQQRQNEQLQEARARQQREVDLDVRAGQLVDETLTGVQRQARMLAILKERARQRQEKQKEEQKEEALDIRAGQESDIAIAEGLKEVRGEMSKRLRELVENDRVTQRAMRVLGRIKGVPIQQSRRKTNSLVKLLKQSSLTEKQAELLFKENYRFKSEEDIEMMMMMILEGGNNRLQSDLANQ